MCHKLNRSTGCYDLNSTSMVIRRRAVHLKLLFSRCSGRCIRNIGLEIDQKQLWSSNIVSRTLTFFCFCRIWSTMAVDEDLELLQILRFQGVDVLGRTVVRIVGKFFPASVIDVERLKLYLLQKLHHELQPGPYVIVYFHTAVKKNDNHPGVWALRDLYESLPNQLKHRLQAVYYVHPGLRSRLLLATLGRFFLSEGFYSKLVYINRLEFLTEYVRKDQVDVPDFVMEHDKELETRPLMDYGFEADPLHYHHGMPLDSASRAVAFR